MRSAGRQDDLECAPRCSAHLQRKDYLIFRVCRGLRAAPNAIFTGGAAMVKGRSELQMQLTVTIPLVKSISAKPAFAQQ